MDSEEFPQNKKIFFHTSLARAILGTNLPKTHTSEIQIFEGYSGDYIVSQSFTISLNPD